MSIVSAFPNGENKVDAADISGIVPIEHGGTGNATGYITTGLSNGEEAGLYATAEGNSNQAPGLCAHAEGNLTFAIGTASHAEGFHAIAGGYYSHAEGTGTQAVSENQHAQGKYNIADESGTYAHIVGNGSDGLNQSNAHTLDWSGNAWFAGNIKVGGTGQNDEDAKPVVPMTVFRTTITADGWAPANGYAWSGMNLFGTTENSLIVIGLDDTATDEQRAAEQAAAIYPVDDGYVGSDSIPYTPIEFHATGDVPAVDLPIIVVIWG